MKKKIKSLLRYCRQRILFLCFFFFAKRMQSTSKDILIIAPHPDDETLGMGGMIAQKKKKGALISIVFLTDGEASLKDIDKEEIISNRIKTSEDVAEIYGIKNIYRLNLPDGKLKDIKEEAIKKLAEILELVAPEEIYCTHYLDKWSDHIYAATLTINALKRVPKNIVFYYYWVWARYYLNINTIHMTKWKNIFLLPIRKEKDVKCLAIGKYKNNIALNGKPYIGILPKQLLYLSEKSSYEVYEKIF